MYQEDDEKKQDEDENQEEQQSDEHAGEYYCGICGWCPISQFPNCH